MPVNFAFAYARPIAQRYIGRGEHEKYLSLPLYRIMENPLMTAHDLLVTVKRQTGDHASFLVLSNFLQNILSKRIVC